jgi:hypothetical protein
MGTATARARPAGPASYDRPSTPSLDPAAASSLTLLERVKGGDSHALNGLLQHYLPRLIRWASGRVPRWARDMPDTEDLVQETAGASGAQSFMLPISA